MAAANTYVAISPSYTLGSATPTVTFSSIPSIYTDLVLIITAGVDGATNTYIRHRYNSSGTALYSTTFVMGDGSTATSTRSNGDSYGYMGVLLASTTNFSVNVTSIQNYANATTYKTHLTRGNNAALKTDVEVGLWRDTTAISSITLYPGTLTNFVTGSTFALYGILAA
jgi:hypothetical protein